MRQLTDLNKPGRMRASSMRKVNGALLLHIIRDKNLVSRAELARLSGLAKPTVSSQVADLIDRGLILEDSAGEPGQRGGKPPTFLRFRPDSGVLIAIEIAASGLRTSLADLDGRTLDAESAPLHASRGADHILNDACQLVQSVLARGRGRKRKLTAIAVAAPGRVNSTTGVVLEAGSVFHWHNVPVRERFGRAFRVPVQVDNDVNFAALGEMHAGLAQGAANFILIRLGTGIGAGLVLGGRLYPGAHWAAGEIGHMLFDSASAAGGAEERGHLELAVGADRIRQRLHLSARHPKLADALQYRSPEAATVLDEATTQLVLAVANLTAVVDPELIVLAGELSPLVTDRIRDLVARVIPWPVRIERSALGEDAALLGALASARTTAQDLIFDFTRNEPQTV